MTEEQRKAVVDEALAKNVDQFRGATDNVHAIALAALRSIPAQDRSTTARKALERADKKLADGEKPKRFYLSGGFLAGVLKDMKTERGRRERRKSETG